MAKKALGAPKFEVVDVLRLEQFQQLSKEDIAKLRKTAEYKRANHKVSVEKMEGEVAMQQKMVGEEKKWSPSKSNIQVQKLWPCIEKYTEMLDMTESDD